MRSWYNLTRWGTALPVLLALTVPVRGQIATEGASNGSFTLRVPPAVALEAGQDAFFTVHLKRENFFGPVALSFSGLPRDVDTSEDLIIPAGRKSWRGMLKSKPGTPLGTSTITVRARAGGLQKKASVQLTITRPLSSDNSPPLSLPAQTTEPAPRAVLRFVAEETPSAEVLVTAPLTPAGGPAEGPKQEALVITAPFAPPPPVPLPEKAAAPPTTPPAERWALMKLIQGTWVGTTLDTERMQITGWTDASVNASSDRNSNTPLGFNYRANDFLLQQNWLRFERSVVTGGTSEPTYGFRSDWILPGADYKYTIARGLFSGQLTANNGQPLTYGIDPIQFYSEAYFPTVGRGLDVKVGRTFCQYGVESNDAVSNVLSSHAYTFIYDPFTHTGVISTLKLTDAWSVQAGAILGPDVFIDRASSPYGMGGVKWAPPTGRTSVLFSFIVGSGRFNQGEDFNNPNIFDLVVTHQINSRLTYNFESLYGYQTNVPDVGFANWFGAIHYLTYTLSPRLSATGRLEFFDDCQGQRTGFRGLYTAATAGLNFRLTRALIFRPELRYDYNGESRPFEDHHGLFTATGDLIMRW